MMEQDTIKLLRECDAGIKMGVSSIDEILPYVGNSELKKILEECKRRHERLSRDVEQQLERYGDEGKDPNFMAKTMSWIKTNVELSLHESDTTIANLMTDGCNMGAKSLHRYLNQYQAADENSKDIAKKLASMEERLTEELRDYL